jgi:hypothetical protein
MNVVQSRAWKGTALALGLLEIRPNFPETTTVLAAMMHAFCPEVIPGRSLSNAAIQKLRPIQQVASDKIYNDGAVNGRS